VVRDYGSSREQQSNRGGSPGGERSEQKLTAVSGVLVVGAGWRFQVCAAGLWKQQGAARQWRRVARR
jgi:hypothetical protein